MEYRDIRVIVMKYFDSDEMSLKFVYYTEGILYN